MRRVLLAVLAAGALTALPSPALATHVGDVNCSAFPTQGAAQAHLAAHAGDPDGLDGDADGVACQTLPCPCSTAAPATAGAPVPAAPPAAVPAARTARARVIRVIDGDTLKVRLSTGRIATVRLIGIDTPETRKPGTPVECGGPNATLRMKQLALRRGVGRTVTLTGDPTQDRVDRYGRMLSYVGAAGADFGRTMVASGWAKSYVYEQAYLRASTYGTAQSAARAANRGVWRACAGNFHSAR